MGRSGQNRLRELLTVTGLYGLLTVIMTWPMAWRPSAHYSIHNDYLQGLWNLWWFRESLVELARNPYFSDYVFHPTGISLAFHTLSITNATLALPLLYVVDLVSAYNVVYLLTFPLAGLGTYLLVHDLTGNRGAAFVAGLVPAFCPYHFVKSYQIWAASLEWMPFFAFFFLRFLRGGGRRPAAAAALMLLLASLSSWYLMAFSFIFIAAALVHALFTRRAQILTARFARDFAFLAGLYGLLVLPFAYPMVREVIWGESHMYTSLYAQFLKGSRGLVGGRTSSTFQVGMTQLPGMRLAGPLFWPGVLGYLPLGLALIGVLRGRFREKRLWIAATLLFFVFMLGPYPTVFDWVYRSIPLPWLLLDHLPIFKAIRYPHRFMAPFMMGLAVLVGGGTAVLIDRVRSRLGAGVGQAGTVVAAILAVLIPAEYFTAPLGSFEVPMSPFYRELAREGPDGTALLEVPVMTPFTTRYMFFQTVHRRPIVGGQIVHPREEIIDFIKTTPVIRELANPVLIEEGGGVFDLPEDAADILADLGIGHVVVHRELLRPYRGSPPPRKGKGWQSAAALYPAVLNPQHDLLQETFYFAMRRKTAFEEEGSLERLLEVLEERLGPPVYADDLVVAYRVDPDGTGKAP
jgi:hypothetical protein